MLTVKCLMIVSTNKLRILLDLDHKIIKKKRKKRNNKRKKKMINLGKKFKI